MKKTEPARSEAQTPDFQPREESSLQKAEVSHSEEQEKYREAYLAQLRRLQCPGCGEAELI